MIDCLDIIDGHVHCFQRDRLDRLVEDIRYTGAMQFCALVVDRNDGDGQWNNALWLKQQMPENVFAFGGLDFQRDDFAEQLQELIDVGCDGLKLLVATSAKDDELELLLEAAGVADLMEQRTSSGGKKSKPDPDIVQAAVRSSRMKPEELIMLGDTPYDVEASIGAHVNLVALLSGGWTTLELIGATAIYDDPADLLGWYDSSPLSVKALAS